MSAARDHAGAFIRFLAVGGSFSLGFAVITAGLIRVFALPPLPTSIVVYLLCIPLAFLAQKKIAFRASAAGRYALMIYASVQVGSLAVVSTISSRFVTYSFLLDTLLYLVTAGSAAVVSYLICRFVIFRPPAG